MITGVSHAEGTLAGVAGVVAVALILVAVVLVPPTAKLVMICSRCIGGAEDLGCNGQDDRLGVRRSDGTIGDVGKFGIDGQHCVGSSALPLRL